MKIRTFFGDPWSGDRRIEGVPHGVTPVGEECMHCGVPIKADDHGVVVPTTKQFGSSDEPTLAPLHRECIEPWVSKPGDPA
jgi:hypothetical protein